MDSATFIRRNPEHDAAPSHAARKPYTAPVFMQHGTIDGATRGIGGKSESSDTMAPLVSGPDALGYL